MYRQQITSLGIAVVVMMFCLIWIWGGVSVFASALFAAATPGSAEAGSIASPTIAVRTPKLSTLAPEIVRASGEDVLKGTKLSATIIDEGFEGAFPPPGWRSTGHWGKSSCASSTGSSSVWAEGTGGLTCSSVYHQNDNSILTYGPFDLGDALTAVLEFDLRLWSAQGDTFFWQASADGVSFYGASVTETFPPVWEHRSLDLSAVPGLGDLRGDSSVWVSFRWQTDDFAEAFDGVYVDNVKITKTTAPAASVFMPLVWKPCPGPDALFHSTLALDAASASYATAQDSSTLDLGVGTNDDFTIETFFFVPDLSNDTIDTLVQKSGSYWLYIIFKNTAPDRFIYRIWLTAIDYVYLDYDTNLSAGWHHAAVTFDNEYTTDQDRLSIFLDGNLVKSATNVEWTPGIRNTSSATTLGGSYTGRLEEVRFSDSVRYSGASNIVPSSPFLDDENSRAIWHFDDAPGINSFIDSSGNGNTLTGVNGAHTTICGG